MLRSIVLLVFVFSFITQSFGQKRAFYPEKIDIENIITKAEKGNSFLLPQQELALYAKSNDFVSLEAQEKHQVKTYDLFAANGKNVGTLVTAPGHIYYNIDNEQGNITSFYPNHKEGGYIFEETSDLYWECAAEEVKNQLPSAARSDIGKFSYGDDLQSFRLAVITTGEYYEQHGNTDAFVRADIFMTLSSVNRIFERDLALNFRIQGRLKLYADKDTDPFTPISSGGSERTTQSASAFASNFDADDYDVGITFNFTSTGWPGGGAAVAQAACNTGSTANGPTKARVWASSRGSAENGFTALVTHELGHAFGARHTMNAGSDRCVDAISDENAYEIGSGNTIMSYGGNCGDDNDYVEAYEVINNYFHSSSLYLMTEYVKTLNCQDISETVNTPPDITVNPCGMASFQVPLSTPFSVRAEGSDLESENLTYVWEQFDEDGPGKPNAGFLGPEASLSTRGPLFRGYAPNANPSRDFPRFFNYFFQDPFETLSKVPRDLTLRCTVRDNDVGGGIFTSDEITVNVVDAGPLLIEIDSLIDTIVGGETINLSWNDDGISGLCDKVDVTLISLTDPLINIPVATGLAYSELGLEYFVASGFSIDGNFHFKVECHVSDCFSFYSYSRPFFSSTNCPAAEVYYICGLDDITANIGAEELNQTAQAYSGVASYQKDGVLNDADPVAQFVRNTLPGECEELKFESGNPVRTNFEYVKFQVSEAGSYRIRNLGGEIAGLSVFEESLFDVDKPCNSLVGTNLTESTAMPGTTRTTFREWVDIDLLSCVEYRLGITAFEDGVAFIASIAGDAVISVEEVNELEGDFFFVVENEDGDIEAIKAGADFRDLRQGQKSIYTIKVDAETFVPADFLGKKLTDLGIEGVCVGRSTNTADVLLINPLPDDDMDGYHTDEDCDDTDPNVNPGALEVLNNTIDENCDGLIEGIDADMDGFNAGFDCDDSNPLVNPDALEIANNDIDEDCDGEVLVIDVDMDGFNSDVDCDDTDAAVNPDAVEIPNNDVDENCDGVVLIIDEDMDGYNSDVDCDDADSTANPGAEEIPNNDVDENCDGVVLIIDEDMDGFNSSVDCNDQDAAINPDAEEIPSNSVDENCDGVVLNFDADMDGFNSEDDCNDLDSLINPDAVEIANNDIDENCDGELLIIDEDNDGFNSSVDCNDLDSLINPGAEEIPNNDVDENCDGAVILIDEDMDGFNSSVDCNDTIAAINPGAVEIPNNDVDEDCDGVANVVDEDQDGFNSDVDCNDLDSLINPGAVEIPNNNIDENCNGELGFIDADMDGFTGAVDCNDQDSLIFPGAVEIPNNGIDENCDGLDMISSVDKHELDEVEVYPNPFSGEFTIDFKTSVGAIEVFTFTGLSIQKHKLVSGQYVINMSSKVPGIYFLRVQAEGSSEGRYFKLIKM